MNSEIISLGEQYHLTFSEKGNTFDQNDWGILYKHQGIYFLLRET